MGRGRRGGGGFGGGSGGGGGMGNMQQMMQQARQMQDKMEVIQEELAGKTLKAQAGGGAVKVAVNGNQELLDLTIDPSVLEDGDAEILQDMVKAAVNDAMKQAKALSDEAMGGAMGNLPIPPGLL